MIEIIKKLMCELLSWHWSGIIQSVTGIMTVCIASLALTSWKKQHKSQKVTDLLDELTDAIHELIQLISIPITRLMVIHIGIESYKHNTDLDNDLEYPEVVSFIEKEGTENAARLMESLIHCEGAIHKIRSLVVKGQVFDIENYMDCQNACKLLTWQYDRLIVVYAILSSGNMNWKHPMVIKNIKNLLEITPDDIKKYLDENQVKFTNFVKNAYQREYENA